MKRWNRTLQIDTACILVAALGGDHYLAELVILLPEHTLALLRQALNYRFPDLFRLDETDREVLNLTESLVRVVQL